MAVVAQFTASSGLLSVFGDVLDNNVTASRDAAGSILVNGGAVSIAGGTPTVANTTLIQVFGQGGNDTLTINEANGALPQANLFGGTGNDILTGGSGNDQLFGQAGNDTLLGKGGNDFLFGGSENDVLTGGDGDDQVFGEGGNDRMIWNPGDDSDLNEGGDGIDTVEVNGGNGAETFTVTANGTRVRFDRLNPAPFSLDIGTTENLVINANGGDDIVTAGNGLGVLIQITVDGGAGNDTLDGGDGNDLLIGGDGDDFVDGNRGNDTALLGAGNDVFQWDPGDGSDTVEGQAGQDTMLFNGANIAENIDISANGGRLRFFRNVANIVMDTNDVEQIDFNALGGADTIVVNDLSGTDVKQINLNLAAVGGGGDGQQDTVRIDSTNGNDVVNIIGSAGQVLVTGLTAQVAIAGAEVSDVLAINGLGDDDVLDASSLTASTIQLTLDAGAGDDTVIGGAGNDNLNGGSGDDQLTGGAGNNAINGGDGFDVIVETGNVNFTLTNTSLNGKGSNVLSNIESAILTGGSSDNILDASGFLNPGGIVVLKGKGGNDTLKGVKTVGNVLNGGAGDDRMEGGDGVDVYIVDSSNDSVIEASLLGGFDIVQSSVIFTLGDNLENLTLTGSNDINGIGNGLDNLIVGNAGGNKLKGKDGNDTLSGAAGDDILIGGVGNDILTGNEGADRFTYNTNAAFNTNSIGVDTITDFAHNEDSIVLDKTTFNALKSVAGNGFSVGNEFAAVNTDDLAGTSGALITYSVSTGHLFYNQNGAAGGFGTGGQFATLNGSPTVSAADFVIQA